MANRLAASTSPYLLQHAHNPVHWQPWDEAALAQAKAEQKPIFLSIGYSACHWCHVMERESFEHEGIAALLNAHFVPIKVDREERPDLDDIYMDAVQALTGRGGWPMSVWLTPDLKPFYGGTYFPRESRGGMPGFGALLERIAELWRERREDLERDASELTETLMRQGQSATGRGVPGPDLFNTALASLRQSFDARWGGFGPAPKFPAHFAVDVILRRGTEADRAMARRTLDAMWEGGMYDHLGGGFARYSVDERWLVPHFEKMLYDNAQLAGAYLDAYRATGEARYGRIARETLDYLLRDMRDGDGGFHSAEDADSEGEEGRFYVFTPVQIEAELGPENAALFNEAFGVTARGNFEHGTSVLHRFSAPKDLAERLGLAQDELEARLRAMADRVLAARSRRVRPGKDDKVLAGWNGLALSALAKGAQVLQEPRYLRAATECATFLQDVLWKEGVLLRAYRAGTAHVPGFLEDYAAVADGLVDLYEASFDLQWLRWAETLMDTALEKFQNEREGGFYFAEAHQPDLLLRPKGGWDGAIPAASTLACRALLRLSRHLDRIDFREAVERALAASHLARAPRAHLALLAVLDDVLREPFEVVVAGELKDHRTQALLTAARSAYHPGMVLSLVTPNSGLPLHEDRGP
ncbi:MAG: thioredoxin domain-containing protein, partial [Firmicutes bacterium]|nr:thioredoxin domain-containing protein [Bacillota bacterium]